MKCIHCDATTDLTERKCADGETRCVCATCIAIARFWVKWIPGHLRELAIKKEAA